MPRGIKCCYKCVAPKRHLGCHATCKDYKDERTQLDADNAKIRQMKEADQYLGSLYTKIQDEASKSNKKNAGIGGSHYQD